jgi:hypothetical protein
MSKSPMKMYITIDADIYPELYATLSNLTGRHRANRLRILAEAMLFLSKTSGGNSAQPAFGLRATNKNSDEEFNMDGLNQLLDSSTFTN